MKNEKNENMPYNIGLDIGTTSVGWAVVDDNFNIIKKKNKKIPLWGVRLFDEAQTAQTTRDFRSNKRRYKRRRERIKLLQEIFKPEIDKVDPDFFNKLNTSNISNKDKNNQKYNLTDFDKKEIFSNLIREKIVDTNGKITCLDNKYPTIYHLRKDLMEIDEKKDIRLIYLAMHHMIKYRGNFNYNIDNFDINNLDIIGKLIEVMESFLNLETDIIVYQEVPSREELNTFSNILSEKSKKDRQKLYEKYLYNYFNKKASKELANSLVGYKFNLATLFGIELDKEIKIEFDSSTFDEKINEVEGIDDLIEPIYLLKELYDMLSLKEIFKDEKSCSISRLMVRYYDIHKHDLHELKELLRPYRNYFKKVFKTKPNTENIKDACLYDKYINNNISYDEFTKEISNILEEIKNNENNNIVDDIQERISFGNYIPRITDTGNGKYPYQINEKELELIIDKQGKYYDFLTTKLDDNTYKIIKLLTFRIPYYVGPLASSNDSRFAWMVRNDNKNEKITPFNFNEVVNIHESAKNFIYRMLGHCTYLLDEFQIPANSILYSKFKVLNELKQIKINDKRLDIDFQHKIYEELFLKDKRTITDSIFKNYLRTCDELSMYITCDATNIDVRGYSADNKFANNMKPYLDFFGENGIFADTNLKEDDAKKIIELLTVFEDKNIVKEELNILYPTLKDKFTRILSLNYKGWSGLSRKLLETPYYVDPETTIKKSIMDLMWETTDNFMQIINDKKYNFQEMIKKENKQEEVKLDYSLVEDLATSPAVKRGIYQSLKIVDEIVNYMGYKPSYVSIEMSRSNEKKQRTEDRRKQLLKLYDDNKKNINNYSAIKEELSKREKIDTEKLLLYFRQEGKSLYSMTPLDINHLEQYDVDHILPQTLIKDDSIDNKALVLQEENRAKSANLVVPKPYRDKCTSWWKHLKDIKLISNKKYNNLIRSNFRNEDIEGFINRQLVETRQITKHVANIISNLYDDTKIIYLKANVSHGYRERFKLYKYRDLNDYHHAHDAYLAITLGLYQERYVKSKIDKIELRNLIEKLLEEKRYKELKYGYVVNSIDQDFMLCDKITGEVLNIEDFTNTIENTLYRNDILISKKTEIKTGEFYNQTLYKRNSVNAKIKIKGNKPTDIYGGYTSYKYSYITLVKYLKKDKEIKKLINIPVVLTKQKNSRDIINNYIKDELKCDNYEILIEKIPINTEIIYSNQNTNLVGSTEVSNNVQFKLKRTEQIKYKDLLNFIFNSHYPLCTKEKDEYLYDNIEFDSYDLFKEYILKEFNNQINNFYDLILNIMEKYYPLYESELERLKEVNTSGEFNNLQLINLDKKDKSKDNEITKVEVIKEIFKMLKCNSVNANLKKLNKTIKFSDRVGRKNSITIKKGTLIYKSPTGLKEKKYEF